MKKNKDIEIKLEETKKKLNGAQYDVTELFIGKKKIGEILEYGPKEFHSFMGTEEVGASKTFDLAMETIISHWNLHE